MNNTEFNCSWVKNKKEFNGYLLGHHIDKTIPGVVFFNVQDSSGVYHCVNSKRIKFYGTDELSPILCNEEQMYFLQFLTVDDIQYACCIDKGHKMRMVLPSRLRKTTFVQS